MKLDYSEWDERLPEFTSQELYYMHEMSKLPQSIGREELVPPPMFPDQPPESIHSINWGQSDKRHHLEERIWEQIQNNTLRFLDRDAYTTEEYAKRNGFYPFVNIWDHWQPQLEEIVCQNGPKIGPLSPEVIRHHLWNNDLYN